MHKTGPAVAHVLLQTQTATAFSLVLLQKEGGPEESWGPVRFCLLTHCLCWLPLPCKQLALAGSNP